MANSTLMTNACENVCLKIGVDLKIDHMEDENDIEATPKESRKTWKEISVEH